MPDRVLSTMTAQESIVKLTQVINGPLLQQLELLSKEGATLANTEVWDGRLAMEFRAEWPHVQYSIVKVIEELEDFRRKIEQINRNIMTAGGNR